MRKKQIFVIIIVFAFISVAGTTMITSASGEIRPELASLEGRFPIDATPEMMGEDEIAMRKKAAEVGSALATKASPVGEPANVGDEFTITVGDFATGFDYDETFVVIMDGDNGIILITKDAYDAYDPLTDEYVFVNPLWGVGGGWTPEDRISTSQLAYLLNQFDTVIYPTVTTYFGEPLPRGEEGQKIWILILNIRDESYYDGSENVFTVGYFSSQESSENNKNIMHIDTYNWGGYSGPGSPQVYEGVFAHEFEHLVHFDQDPDEPSWVDEGLADMAIFLCGYGHFTNHIIYYLVFHPFTPLTFWGGGLEDYGASYLFQLYLYEHYGGAAFTSALVQEQANGIEGIQNVLDAFGYTETFDEIFDDWTIANYLDGEGKYGYSTLDIGSADTGGWSIEYALEWFWELPAFGAKNFYQLPIGFYSLFGPPMPYTVHYYRFGADEPMYIAFNGDDYAGIQTIGDYSWHSGMEIWAYNHMLKTLNIPLGGATLTFDTWYDIEEDWDYGYIEVYDYDTDTWTTLADDTGYTTNILVHDQDNPNCPDDLEPTVYNETGNWNAFTGNSGGWISVSFDLSAFKGHKIDLFFRLWQDGAFTLLNWFVDSISIPELGISEDAEDDVTIWDDLSDWERSTGIWPVNWAVTYIETLWQPQEPYRNQNVKARKLFDKRQMLIDPGTQTGYIFGIEENPVASRHDLVAIVSNRVDHIIAADYILILGI